MDPYTIKTKQYLDNRNCQTTPEGFFFAHQNIYGFKSPHVEEGVVLRYVIALNVAKALKMLRFDSLLDVGGAEGYMAALFQKLFKIRARSCDLSNEACRRAREIFNIEADPVDGVKLPYEDNAFDVVLSSETLEHIENYEGAFREILRVARKAAVITVPHDTPESIADNIRRQIPHAHIHVFSRNSFKELIPPEYTFRSWGLYSAALRFPYRLVEGRPVASETRSLLKRPMVWLLNIFINLSKNWFNEGTFKFLFSLDGFLAHTLCTERQLLFLIVKDPSVLISAKIPRINVDDVLNFKVPLEKGRLSKE